MANGVNNITVTLTERKQIEANTEIEASLRL